MKALRFTVQCLTLAPNRVIIGFACNIIKNYDGKCGLIALIICRMDLNLALNFGHTPHLYEVIMDKTSHGTLLAFSMSYDPIEVLLRFLH